MNCLLIVIILMLDLLYLLDDSDNLHVKPDSIKHLAGMTRHYHCSGYVKD